MTPLDDYGIVLYDSSKWEVEHVIWSRTCDELKVHGVMHVHRDEGNGPEVYKVAAEDGLGPWLYIHAIAEHNSLCPCQEYEKVTEEASAVWEYFYNEGQESREIEDSPHYGEWLRRVYLYDYNITDYEQELCDACSKRLSNEELEEVKRLAEEFIDKAMEKIYG